MKMLRLMLIGLLAGTLAVSACGKKGDPNRPTGEQTEEQPAS
jgi:hypothetical protein